MSDQIINLNSDIYNFLSRLCELLEEANNIMIGPEGETFHSQS